MKTLVVLQPGYLPWIGFFDQLNRSDVFIYYDDVQYDKNGWRNRNRIKSPQGILWLSVPVLTKGIEDKQIKNMLIDNRSNWNTKQLKSISMCYAKAPYFKNYFPELEELLSKTWDNICELDIALVELISKWLKLERKIYRSSELGIYGSKSERLLNFCKHLGADNYLSGNAAQDYLDVDLFKQSNINITWQDYEHPVYEQINGEFIPYLSVIDLIFNMGEESRKILNIDTPSKDDVLYCYS